MKLMKLALPLLVLFSLIMITACDDRSSELQKYQMNVTVSPDTIYADNGITYSEVQVLVKDNDDFAVTLETVKFSSTIGHMNNSVLTDSSGVATSFFWDTGVTGEALITAYVGDISKRDTVYVLETPEITDLHVVSNSTELEVADVVEFKAVAMNSVGYVPDGTLVSFTCTLGYFTDLEDVDYDSSIQVETSNGSAKTYYNSGAQAGTSTITAMVGDVVDTKDMTIHPGSASYIYMSPDVTEIEANSGQTVNILTQVEDVYHNPVESGVSVDFTTTLGNITLIANTDSLGIAEAEFAPGIEAGVAEIVAVSDSATSTLLIDVISDDVNSISFVTQDLVAIDVAGTGGDESAELRVALKDLSGNLVSEDYLVYFELVDYPLGVEINQEGSDDDAVMSVNGEAIVSIKSGSEAGAVKIRAYTITEAGIEISASKTNIIVQAGPPSSVEFTIGGIDEAENVGGGLWRIQIAALVTDEWNNPVSDGNVIFFSIDGNPQYATIETGDSYVGNFNTDQDSIPGVAYSYLTFDGSHTNDEITIKAETGSSESGVVEQSSTFPLPLQQGQLDVIPVPGHFEWGELGNPDYADIELRILLKDGQGNHVNNQVLMFDTTMGIPLEPTPADTGDAYSGITGVGTEAPYVGIDGILYKIVRVVREELPEPDPGSSTTMTLVVNISVLGTDVTGDISILLIRYL